MVKLLKKKKAEKKVEKKINVGWEPTEKSVELPEDIQLSWSAAIAQKINLLTRAK